MEEVKQELPATEGYYGDGGAGMGEERDNLVHEAPVSMPETTAESTPVQEEQKMIETTASEPSQPAKPALSESE